MPAQMDPDLAQLVSAEDARQAASIELIASENYTSASVRACLGSCLTNKYSEGYPGARYYGGNEVIDQIENLATSRVLAAFRLDPEQWVVNVQPYSGSPANFAVYTALLQPHDRIMGLDLSSGGHLTHGFQTAKRRVSATSVYFESMSYKVGADGRIDYDEMERLALAFRPKLLIVGASAYNRDFDYARFRSVADKVGAYLMGDIAHIAGFVAAGLMKSPFDWCDVVTTTTHKTFRGPRAGMIFCKKGLAQKVRDAVFPGLQGGPHNHQIAGIAAAAAEAATPEFREYMTNVRENARCLAAELESRGYKIVGADGISFTDNHLFLVDLRPKGLTGAEAERRLEASSISVNKNTIPGDTSALKPSGLRIGTSAITSRGLKPEHMPTVADFIDAAITGSCKKEDIAAFMTAFPRP